MHFATIMPVFWLSPLHRFSPDCRYHPQFMCIVQSYVYISHLCVCRVVVHHIMYFWLLVTSVEEGMSLRNVTWMIVCPPPPHTLPPTHTILLPLPPTPPHPSKWSSHRHASGNKSSLTCESYFGNSWKAITSAKDQIFVRQKLSHKSKPLPAFF